jgi:hypothetical protein
VEKFLRLILIFIVVAVSLFSSVSNPVEAANFEESKNSVGVSGDWEWTSDTVTGKEIPMEKVTIPNADNLQSLSNALSLSGPSEICHSFRGGQFGWTGIIYNLSGGSWHKLETTSKWVPNTEGKLMACAYAPSEGTYALFGYYTATTNEKECGKYSISSLETTLVGFDGFIFYGAISPPEVNIQVSYKIKGIKPAGSITGALSDTVYTGLDGSFSFTQPFYIDFETAMSFNQVFYVDGCEADYMLE